MPIRQLLFNFRSLQFHSFLLSISVPSQSDEYEKKEATEFIVFHFQCSIALPNTGEQNVNFPGSATNKEKHKL